MIAFEHLLIPKQDFSRGISGFRREVLENFAGWVINAARSGNFSPTFRDNLSGPIFKGESFFFKGH